MRRAWSCLRSAALSCFRSARSAPTPTSPSCVSPGFLRTGLGREAKGSFRLFLTMARPFQQSPGRGAETVISAMNQRVTGAYFRGTHEVAPSRLAMDDAAAARLWELSARWLQPSQVGQ